jgi:four helix bundle protein
MACVEPRGFEELAVYQRSAALADEIRDAVHGWNLLDRWSSGIQTIRAADSIGANIAEATGRWSHVDQSRFLFMARGSVHELQHWLARASARDLPCPPDAHERSNKIGRMLNGLIRSFAKSGHILKH